jgi:hypothetical protein
MKSYYRQIFILSGVLAATCFFAVAILFLTLIIITLNFNLYTIAAIVPTLFYMCGYMGLLMSMMGELDLKYPLKLFFLVMGIISSCLLLSIFCIENVGNWSLNFEDAKWYFLFIWQLVVSIVLAISEGRELIKLRHG